MLTKQNARRAAWLVGIAAIALVLCSKSSPLYVLNDWMDANIFFTMGKSMFRGKVLYRDVFDHKGPVLYFLYGLASLIDYTGFTGVLVVEIIAFALFLHCGLRTAELLVGRALHPAWAVLPAAGIAASRAFAHGGSAEELCLPLLGAALYAVLRFFAARPDRRRPLPQRQRPAGPMTLTAQEAAGSVVVAETAAAPEKTDTKAVDKQENRAYIDVQEILPQVSPDEAAVLRLLEDGKQPVDRLIDETQLPAGRILSALTLLEVKGYVKRLPARYYELAKK